MKLLCAAALLCAACGGTSAGGTIHGNPFNPVDSIYAVFDDSAGDSLAEILVASPGGLCAAFTASRQPKSLAGLLILVQDRVGLNSGTAPAAAGTYTITSSSTSAGKVANAIFQQQDANCQNVSADAASAVAGTVSLSSVSGGTYAGTYDFTMSTGEHINGSFTAGNCPAAAGSASTCG